MYCAALELIAPAFGRLLPMPSLGPWGAFAISGMLLLYACIGIGFDLMQYRWVHPAWWWGVAAIVSLPLSLGPIAFSPAVRVLGVWSAPKGIPTVMPSHEFIDSRSAPSPIVTAAIQGL